MKSKIESMKVDVWILVDPPKGINFIWYKWIFKRKRGTDGKVETYKAYLDYNDEIFFLVAILKFIWIMLAIVTHLDYKI